MVPDYIREELDLYQDQIRQFRAGELGEVKMQKLRLHYGTYAQRQEGVQMQRIKIPGGILNADQLVCLADAADRYGSGFVHFTTREDVQLYYVKLEEAPDLLRFLAEAGITTREACGNTVRNITACYRAGTSSTEAFDVSPYAEALFRFLVRNKYNQNLGRKFKITFEGCAEDHSGLRIHDIGFLAQTRSGKARERRGFRVYLGGGLGGAPHLGHLYTEFLPEEQLFNLAVSVLRLFDRYGERKARMKARMKFLIQTMGWNPFRQALDEERRLVGPIDSLDEYLDESRMPEPEIESPSSELNILNPRTEVAGFQQWVRDSVIPHRNPGLRGVHVRMKLGDLLADDARSLADVVRRFSAGQLRISIGQNLYLPWVREQDLPDLHSALADLGLAESGAETITDVTTCPGSDTCRLGIASAKGLGSTISEALEGDLAPYRELARSLKIKISGCPNGCAQHSVADIGFHAAALSQDGRTVPAYLLFLGGKVNLDDAEIGRILGRFPAKNGVAVVETLLDLFQNERQEEEDFGACMARIGDERLKELLEPLKRVATFEEDPSFYQDWGHENERFAVRQGIKGECAGSTVAEKIPAMDAAWESLAQGEAYFYHHEYEHASIAAYEAAAQAARVPLYNRLVDPFTSEQALWEFENIFVLSGQTLGAWNGLWSQFDALKRREADEPGAREILDLARKFLGYCANFSGEQEAQLAAAAGGRRV
jgi:sulfite reductase beta subunit-like hemoprotein